MVVAGATQSGKTTTVMKLLAQAAKHFQPAPRRVVLFYNCDQSIYHDMGSSLRSQGIEVQMEPTRELSEEDLQRFASPSYETLILIDDSTIAAQKSIQLAHLFTVARHYHVSLVVFLHSIFGGNQANRIIAQNTMYYFLQNSPRMRGQVQMLGSQMGMRKELQGAFDRISGTPYSHVFVDLHPTSKINNRVRTNITTTSVV